MISKIKICLLAVVLNTAPVLAQDYFVQVSGFVCEFCAFGVSKKVSKLPFVDRKQYDKGVLMDPENQTVTIAVKDDAEFDKASLVEAIESAGYKVESISTRKYGDRQVKDS